jgi:hypothetical protein
MKRGSRPLEFVWRNRSLVENLFFSFLMVEKEGEKDTGHVDRYVSERSCIDSSRRLKCGAKKCLCIVEELKVRGSLLNLKGHPSCLAGLFPLVRVVVASKSSVAVG